MLNVMDLHNATSTGLVNPEPLGLKFDNPLTDRNRKSSKLSNPQSRDRKDFNLKDKDTNTVDTYGVCHQLAPVTKTVSTSRLLRKINLE